MAINQELIGDEASVEFTPTETLCDVIIEDGADQGQILLQVKAPGSIKWLPVMSTKGANPILTPDPALTYRFKANGVLVSTLVYMGP